MALFIYDPLFLDFVCTQLRFYISKKCIDAKYKIEKVTYAYQYQDKNGEMIFRYDNAVHKPALGFKEHKHTKDEAIIEAPLPDISDIIDEVAGCL